MRLLGTIMVVAALSGCSAGPARLTGSSVPADFTLEVRDSTGDGAMFIVEPDRWFRAATGATPDGYFYPPATRLLTPEQMEAVWGAVKESGLLRDSGFARDQAYEGHAPLWIQVQTDRKRITIMADPAKNEGAVELLRHLHQLAWIRR